MTYTVFFEEIWTQTKNNSSKSSDWELTHLIIHLISTYCGLMCEALHKNKLEFRGEEDSASVQYRGKTQHQDSVRGRPHNVSVTCVKMNDMKDE
jgi:hypothetical protein